MRRGRTIGLNRENPATDHPLFFAVFALRSRALSEGVSRNRPRASRF